MTSRRNLGSWRVELAVLAEVTAVTLGGALLGRLATRSLGLASYRDALVAGEEVHFLALAGPAAVEHLVRFTIMLAIALLFAWWHGLRQPRDWGLTRGGRSWWYHLRILLVLFAAANLLPAMLRELTRYMDLGQGAAHWSAFDTEWGLGFWLFMAATSFVLPPMLEELLVRGYYQNRLTQVLGPAPAIIVTAVSFAFAHGQYLRWDGLALASLVAVLLGSLATGYVFHRTGSLIAPVGAHALSNIPVRDGASTGAVVVIVLILGVAAVPVARWGRGLVEVLDASIRSCGTWTGFGIVAVTTTLALTNRTMLVSWGALLFVTMVLLRLLAARDRDFA